MAFDLHEELAASPAPAEPDPFDEKEWTRLKRQYSDDLSRLFSAAMERSLETHFPRVASGEGRGVNAASAEGIKSVDVTFTIEGLFLGLGISTKVVGLPEPGHGYTHNFKRLTEEWTLETVTLHRYMPYAVLVGILFLPRDAMTDRTNITSLASAVTKFRGFQGREDENGPAENMEKTYVGIFDPEPTADGWVRFFDVRHGLDDRVEPSSEQLLSFEQVKDELVALFKKRNPKLRVKGMP
jgi:hypothetical protein